MGTSSASSGGASPHPLLADPTLLAFTPLAALVLLGKRRKRAWWSYPLVGLLLITTLVGMGFILMDGFNPPVALAAPYNPIGLRQDPANPQTTVIHYTYDPLYRLTQASYSSGANFTYTYDDADRLTTVNTLAGTGSIAEWDCCPKYTLCGGDFAATC